MDKKYALLKKWKHVYKKYPPFEKVKMISKDIGRDMLTILDYLLRLKDASVSTEVASLKKDLIEDKFHITENWMKSMKKDSTSEIIKKISNETGLSPTTITQIAMHSPSFEVRKISAKKYYELMDKKHNYTEIWSTILRNLPQLRSVERAEKVAGKCNLKLASIVKYATHSSNINVKRDAYKAKAFLNKRPKSKTFSQSTYYLGENQRIILRKLDLKRYIK